MFKFIILIFFNYIYSTQFETSIGKCYIINNHQFKLLQYEELIKKESLRLVTEYGAIKKTPYQIIFPKTKKEFFQISKTAPEWGIAITKNKENKIIIQPTVIDNISKNRLNEIIIHELNHLYIHRLVNSNSMPSWFIEGLAMKFSKEFSYKDKIEISNALWKQKLLPLEGLNNFNTKNKYVIKLAYAQAAAALNALEYYYGKKITHQIIFLLKQKYKFWEAVLEITGDDKFTFQIKYESYLKKYFLWIFLLKTTNILFMLFPFVLILGYYLKRNNNIKILKKWEIEEELYDNQKEEFLN